MQIKRTMALILAALLASSAVACGSSDANGAENTTENDVTSANSDESVNETETSPYDALEDRNFEGRTFTILDANPNPQGLQINIPEDEMNGEVVNDALIIRDNAIEDRYNISIEYVSDTNADKVKSSVLAGDNEYDLVYSNIYQFAPLATESILADLCSFKDIDLSDTWWSPLMAEKLTLNNRLYFTASDIAPSIYQAPLCMFLNLKLWEDYNFDIDVYETVLDGKWTYDVLTDLTKDLDQDLNGDGKMLPKDDFFGVGMQTTDEISIAFMESAGLVMIELTPDKTNITLASLSGTDIVDRFEKIIKVARNIKHEDINDIINYAFKEDRALFLQHKLESAGVHLRDMKSDYLILPMPKYSENEDYISGVSGYVSSFAAVPATVDSDFTGFILEALARYSNENLRPLSYDLVYKQKTSRDERSNEILDLIFDTLYIDFLAIYDFGGLKTAVTNIIFHDKPISSTIEACSASAEKAIEKFVENW